MDHVTPITHSGHEPHDHNHRQALLRQRQLVRGVIFTALLLSVIALAIKAILGTLAFVLIGSVVFVVAVFHRVFPGSRFFTIALANSIGVYACIFMVIVESNFRTVAPRDLALGFIMPLLAFLFGACLRQATFRRIILSRHLMREANLTELFLWMIPMVGMIALTFVLPADVERATPRVWFLTLMAITSVIVFFVSRDIATFLLDVGLVFEGFFEQAGKLMVPIFAFLTFYSLLSIGFAAAYAIVDRLSVEPDFIIEGVQRPINFAESLYFSIVTLSMVGYGDIVPHTGLARLLVMVEIVMGVLLLFFGFSAIIRHSQAGQRRDRDDL